MESQRYKLTIAYRGTLYHGWQKQIPSITWRPDAPDNLEGIPTVQQVLEDILVDVLRHPLKVVGSSRTDAGVHAKGQVAHVDTTRTSIPPENLRRALNARLPADIVVRSIEPVPNTFDAAHSTERKRYQYAIWNHPERSAFYGDFYFHRWSKLDTEAMSAGAAHLVGTHDFASFARPGHGRESTIRTIFGFDVTSRGNLIVLGVEGSGFLWNQVRIMVGTLVAVGMGRIKEQEIADIRDARDRKLAGQTAPPHGLFLQWIKFQTSDPMRVTEDSGEGTPSEQR